jgi:hypothetical protein
MYKCQKKELKNGKCPRKEDFREWKGLGPETPVFVYFYQCT